jgi:putative DNA primase/helicase
VRITEDGWKVEDKITVPLIRGQGMRPLPVPVPGGGINELRPFTNTRSDQEFVLFCGCTAGLFNTFGNYTTTIFCGPAGSGKTTACRVMRRLVDPNKVDTKPFSSVRDLRHGAGTTHVVALENISDIPDDFSDEICRLNTGLSFAERLYYSQGIEFQLDAHCPVLINGIPGNLAGRDDLIDRTVTFSFTLLGDKLISDDVFWQAYEEARPRLLGALLDGVVGALRVRRQFGDDNDAAGAALLDGWRPRFVDFAVFAEAACRAMGFPDGAFAGAYKNNQDYSLRYFAERNPICVGIRGLIAAQGAFLGYPEQLYEAIKPYTHNARQRFMADAARPS